MHRNTTSPGELGWTQGSLSSGRVIATLGVVLAVLLGSIATGTSSVSAAAGYNFALLTTVSVGPFPNSAVVSPDGSRVYVASSNSHVEGTSNSVSVIDTSLNTVTATVTVGSYPTSLAVSPSGSRVYVANSFGNSVSVIDTSSNTVTATVAVGSYPSSLLLSPDGSRLYLINANGNSMTVIDTASNTVTATLLAGSNPSSLAVSPDGSRLYVAKSYSNSVSVIDTSSNTETATVNVGSTPTRLVVSPDGSHVYVVRPRGNWSSKVSLINTSSNTMTATIDLDKSAQDLVVSPDGSRVYVSDLVDSTVSVIGASLSSVIALVSVGRRPTSMALSPDGSRLFVTNDTDGYVRFINTATNRISPPVTVGSNPSKLVTSADGSRLYVTNTDDDSVSVIDISAWPTAPAAPTTLNATPGNGSVSIAFTAGSNGGAAITKYQYKVGSGAWTDAVGTTSPITLSGLTNYVTSVVRLRAVNAVGNSAASSPVSVIPRQAGPAVTAARPSGSTGIVVTFDLNPLPGTTVSYQSAVAYARDTNTVKGSCRTYGKQATCYIGGLTRATNYDLRVTAHLPVPGKTWHNQTFAGSILQVTTNR